MCGILAISLEKDSIKSAEVEKMLSTISHRGKNSNNIIIINDNLAMAQARLAIIDLSTNSNGPITNEDSTIFLTYNGEIYNYDELRKDLLKKGHIFKSNGDAEILVHGYEEWGIDVLNKIEGMFAFALYNKITNEILCARDYVGIKPLYYAHFNNNFIVASEIKAILAYTSFKKELNYSALADYFVYRYVPSPNTIYKNIYKLQPASYITFKDNKIQGPYNYWELKPTEKSYKGNIIEEVKSILLTSVKNQLKSDVPVGIFLSGGIDSSTIALLTKQSGYTPLAFTIGFNNWEKSEHIKARIICENLNIELKEKLLDQKAIENVDESAYYYDEPIADISIVPTFEVSRLASKYLSVVLSGEGGDELFAGYEWHKNLMKNLWAIKLKPNGLVKFYADAMSMGKFDKNELKLLFNKKFHKYINTDVYYFYKKNYIKNIHPLKALQYLDFKTFLAELVLTKVDRASMAHTLEVRVPFLNKHLIEFMFSLSPNVYFNKNTTKYILKEILKNNVSDKIINLPKQGFVGPDKFYECKEYYKKKLENSALINEGIINKIQVNKYFQNNEFWKLWKIFVLETWFKKWIF